MSEFAKEMEKRLHTFGKDVQNLVRKMTDINVDEGFVPDVDIFEDDKTYFIYADLPGMSKDQITLTVKEGILTIKGERKTISEAEFTITKRERKSGPFSRSVTLPEYIDTKDVKASFRKGVLEIRLPKIENGKTESSIEIE